MSFVIVQYFYDLPTLSLAKRLLETEGIKFMTKDELSMQIGGDLATATATLSVDKKDYARASNILIEGDLMIPSDNTQGFGLTDLIDNLAHSIPGVNKLSKELRLIIVSFLLISIPFGLAILVSI